MKPSYLFCCIIQGILLLALFGCNKSNEYNSPPLPRHYKDKKPDTPIPLGTIRAYFGDYYKTFSIQPGNLEQVDSSSNICYYWDCNSYQINMIRADYNSIIEIFLFGYSLEELPVNEPLPEIYGKYPSINHFPFGHWNWGDPSYFSLAYYVRKCIFIITDKKDDILTGTFKGMLESSTGMRCPITEGEFKIKVFRKYRACVPNNGN